MGALKILQVSYQGDRYEFKSPELNQRLSIIEGPNGTGKSTFFNLVHYGLGGKVDEFSANSQNKHAEIVGDTNNYVLLRISIDGVIYSLIRKIGDNNITVRHDGNVKLASSVAEIETFPIFRREDLRIFSDWILEKLGIPVVEIYQGGRSFKLNFSDLSRLIYHNQAPDPHGIYKPADSSTFISDSLEIRAAIFQVLVGKTLLALYEAIGNLKRAERELDSAKGVLREYQQIVHEVLKEHGNNEVRNSRFLVEKINSIDAQLDKLLRTRSDRVSQKPAPSALLQAFDYDRRQLGFLNSELRRYEDKAAITVRDKAKLTDVNKAISEDIERVAKVIFTHQQLNIFSSDTCPYCLSAVMRTEGHCVCGNKVDENEYQRFFYSANEYIDIYRAKRKSLDTVHIAIENIDNDLSEIAKVREALTSDIAKLTQKIDESYSVSETELNDAQVEQYDEKIFDLRNEQNELSQALKMEKKLEVLQRKCDSQKEIWESAKLKVEHLHLASKDELRSRLREFSDAYNDFMTNVLAGCRVANIDSDTYMPIINDGEYREASADVPKRFLYYLTLLKLSLEKDIPFPRLLLVDTPETAGIDRENLILMLRQMKKLNQHEQDYQILLSTGRDKFPPEFADFVAVRLSDDSKLLKPRV